MTQEININKSHFIERKMRVNLNKIKAFKITNKGQRIVVVSAEFKLGSKPWSVN